MSIWMMYLTAAPILVLIFAGTWVYQRFMAADNDAGIVDVIWGLSLASIALYCAAVADGDLGRRVLMASMALAWGIRLAWHIHHRSHGKPEDTRYAHMREEWGERVQAWFFALYQIQAVAAWLMCGGFVVLAADERALSFSDPWLILGLVMYVIAFAGEAISDKQLADFKSDPKNAGRVMRAGLWAYSRHPNYFFECMIWVAFAVIAIGAKMGWLALVPASVIIFLLTRFSGVPNNEAHNKRTKGDAYRAYRDEVSAFIPWFPKK